MCQQRGGERPGGICREGEDAEGSVKVMLDCCGFSEGMGWVKYVSYRVSSDDSCWDVADCSPQPAFFVKRERTARGLGLGLEDLSSRDTLIPAKIRKKATIYVIAVVNPLCRNICAMLFFYGAVFNKKHF